ncbi:MAG TPA: hypothetical protein VFJ86_15350, partial [Usitatibacter sp.]|nr:hypothetical protein [Usitatibacter sp.]
MTRALRGLAAALFLLLPLGALAAPFAYVANGSDDSVSVVDVATGTIVATVALPPGSAPAGIAVNPVLPRAYVVNTGTNTLSVIDTATNTIVATTVLGNGAVVPTASPDGTRLYIPNFIDNTISIVETSTNAIV